MEPLYDLTGKVALITGASRGLGRALAHAFARAGARLALCARDARALEAVAAEIRSAGGEVETEAADVTDAAALERLARAAERRWGPITVLVNNAAILGPRVPLRDYPVETWRHVLDVNLTGAFIAARTVLPGMRRAGTGSIIGVTSGVGARPRAEWGAYAVSKWGLEALTYNLALEEREAGIRANLVDPGPMRTEMRRTAYPEEEPATLPPPEEVTPIFLWLASDASRPTTGQRFLARDWSPP